MNWTSDANLLRRVNSILLTGLVVGGSASGQITSTGWEPPTNSAPLFLGGTNAVQESMTAVEMDSAADVMLDWAMVAASTNAGPASVLAPVRSGLPGMVLHAPDHGVFLESLIVNNHLLNVNFGGNTKSGLAAIGQNANDYWNPYIMPGQDLGSLPNLLWSDQTASPVDLTVEDAEGIWGSPFCVDPMYRCYVYPWYTSSFTVALSQLPADTYDFYIYAARGTEYGAPVIELLRDGVSLWTKGTSIWGNGWYASPWEEHEQYVRFRNIAVNNQTIVVRACPDASGLATLSGLQIVRSAAIPAEQPAVTQLLNLDFGGSGSPTKTGFAATGRTSADFWNGVSGGSRAYSLSNLKWSDQAACPAVLTVLNGAGAWGNSLPDPMFRNYIYSGNGGNLTITLSGLPSGTCDVYAYGHSVTTNDNAIFELWSDDANWGTKGTSLIGPGPTYAGWELGQQYVLFKDVAVTAGKPLVLHSKHDIYGYNNVCGLQLAYKGPLDADADGLADGWEMRFFENLDASASGDADGDGLSNLREYQIGTEPARSDSNANGISDLNDLERLWLEDATPRGAYPGGAGESFTWVSSWWDGSGWGGSTLLPHSGRWWDATLPALMHVSALVPNAMHQHYFHSSVPTLRPVAGDVLYAYVSLDPTYPPAEVMLQWYVIEPNGYGSWEHRAYWGANNIAWGTQGTDSRRYMGTLPTPGRWVRLEVPASAVGLEGKIVEGMAFTLWGGRAAWDNGGLINPDHDGDGLPDWWETKYFGDLLQTGSQDYDGDGTNNSAEFLALSDPNTISFLTSFVEDHVNSNNVPATIEVLRGVPVQMAVLVNTTNCPPESWASFSPIFTVTLPLEGTNVVRVGLRGLPEDAEQTWDLTVITCDTTPPLIIVTNPIAGTTSIPMIQLQGYSPEPLSAVFYDISNSVVLITNLAGHVTHQHFDTNLHAFTTNYFQCFDVDLTNGCNSVTLRATDLAGNTAVLVTNFTLTLDSTPPGLSIGWPTNGTKICSDSFTLYGWLSDPTAIPTLTLINGTETATFTGLVERDGRFWFENLPLSAGSSQLTLTAVDAWGNSASTNFNVVKSGLLLTLNEINPSDLLQSTILISGTVNDPGYTIRVNGVSATITSGTWTASVPVPAGGTAIFDVTAYAPGHDLDPAFAESKRTPVDQPFRIYIEHHAQEITRCAFQHLDIFANADGHAGERIDWSETYNTEQSGHDWREVSASPGWWIRCQGGVSQLEPPSTNFCIASITWPPTKWPTLEPGTWAWNEGECHEPRFPQNPPCVVMEQGQSSIFVHRAWDPFPTSEGPFISGTEQLDYSRSARSTVKVFTGGKALPKSRAVVALYAWASEVLDPWAGCSNPGERLIAASETTVGDFGKPVPDYWLAASVANGITLDATVRTPRKNYRSYLTGSRHDLVTRTFATSPPDRTRTALGVGEEVDVYFEPGLPITVTWTTSAGSLSQDTGSATVLTAPSNAVPNVTVIAAVGGASLKRLFGVVEPAGYDHADIVSTRHFASGLAAAQMDLRVYIAPTNVSFYRVQIREVGQDATSISGAFELMDPNDLRHNADSFVWLTQENTWIDDCQGGAPAGYPGGFTWVVPVDWWIPGAPLHYYFTEWEEVFSVDSQGTYRIDKFNRAVQRTLDDVVSTE